MAALAFMKPAGFASAATYDVPDPADPAPASVAPAPSVAPGVLPEPATVGRPVPVAPKTSPANAATLRPCWQDLRARLARDGIAGPKVDALLATLGPLTQAPMGRKMRELYRKSFFPEPPKTDVRQLYYKGVVTESAAKKCRAYLAANRPAFARAEDRYGVPAEVAVALLYVETSLGEVLADVPENAFQTLASMAESRVPEDIPDWLGKLKGWEGRRDWMISTMNRKADWAYTETRALVRYMLKSGLAPSRFPGSIYGAVGLCQFMPSNIPVYGADGTGDGIVDLFTVPDAVMSLSNYLAKHGWKPGLDRDRQNKVIMTYNHSIRYSASILALADLVAGRTPPADVPLQAQGKKESRKATPLVPQSSAQKRQGRAGSQRKNQSPNKAGSSQAQKPQRQSQSAPKPRKDRAGQAQESRTQRSAGGKQ